MRSRTNVRPHKFGSLFGSFVRSFVLCLLFRLCVQHKIITDNIALTVNWENKLKYQMFRDWNILPDISTSSGRHESRNISQYSNIKNIIHANSLLFIHMSRNIVDSFIIIHISRFFFIWFRHANWFQIVSIQYGSNEEKKNPTKFSKKEQLTQATNEWWISVMLQ